MEDLSYLTRNHEFMKAVDIKAEKLKRDEFKVQLRKSERIAIFERKRGKINPENFLVLIEIPEVLGVKESLTNIEKLLLCRDFLSSRNISKYEVLKYLRKNLDLFKEDFISLLVTTGFLEVLSRLLENYENEECLRETSSILCGITYGPHEYIKLMFEFDLVYRLFILISNESLDIAANAIWALSNIMCDCKDYWNYIIDNKFLSNLSRFTGKLATINGMCKKCLIVGLKSICTHAEDLFLEDFTTIYNILKKVNKTGFDWQSLAVLANLVKQPNGVFLFIEYKFVSNLMQCIEIEGECGYLALKVLTNMNLEQESVPRMLLENGLIDRLEKNLLKNSAGFVKDTLWTIDCLLISSQYFMYNLINNKILTKVVLHLLNPNEKIRLESSFILINCLELGNQTATETFFQLGTVSLALQGLIFPDPTYLKNLLVSLQLLCKRLGPETLLQDPFYTQIFKLEFHVNTEIKELASLLILQKPFF